MNCFNSIPNLLRLSYILYLDKNFKSDAYSPFHEKRVTNCFLIRYIFKETPTVKYYLWQTILYNNLKQCISLSIINSLIPLPFCNIKNFYIHKVLHNPLRERTMNTIWYRTLTYDSCRTYYVCFALSENQFWFLSTWIVKVPELL